MYIGLVTSPRLGEGETGRRGDLETAGLGLATGTSPALFQLSPSPSLPFSQSRGRHQPSLQPYNSTTLQPSSLSKAIDIYSPFKDIVFKMKTDLPILMADANHPLISTDSVREEMLLYNIDLERLPSLCKQFSDISGRFLDENIPIGHLSGGQKVILMACLLVFCPAKRIMIIDLAHSLDVTKLHKVQELLQLSGKDIRYGF